MKRMHLFLKAPRKTPIIRVIRLTTLANMAIPLRKKSPTFVWRKNGLNCVMEYVHVGIQGAYTKIKNADLLQ